MNVDSFKPIAIWIAWIFFIAGVSFLICLRSKWIQENKYLTHHRFWYVSEACKSFPALFQIILGFYVEGQKAQMVYPLAISSLGYIAWTFAQKKQSQLKEKNTEDLGVEIESLRKNIDGFVGVNAALNQCVKKKIERITKNYKANSRPTVEKVRNALKPSEHLNDLLESIGYLFSAETNNDQANPVNFRVGVYLNISGKVRPIAGIDLAEPGYSPFVSFEKYPVYFRMDNRVNQSNVVKCIQSEKTIIVGDCQHSALSSQFSIYHEAQNNYLKSMVAYFLGKCLDDDANVTTGCIAVDCNDPGFFDRIGKDRIYNLLESYSSRIKLELILVHLLNDGGKND